MTPRLGLRLLALALPVALLAPGAAHAEKVVTEDAVGDALLYADGDGALEDSTPAPDQTGVDVVRTVAAHGDRRLRVQVHFRALERDPLQFTVIGIATPEGAFEVVVERLGGNPVATIAGRREEVECRGLKAQVDLRTDVVTASLPTSCIGSARWVRVGVGAVGVDEDAAGADLGAYADDGHRDGEVRDRIALGPRVRRG